MAKQPCRHPRCPALVDSGYCEQHRPASPARFYDNRRGSSGSRGYDYVWQKFREGYLKRHPLCVDCLALKPVRVTAATEPHHILKVKEYPELRLVDSNLLALCKGHHTIRTSRGE